MARGGYRRPSGGPRAGGPGKNSQRTDANEVPTPSATAPRVGENSGLAYGDRQKFEESRKIAPIKSSGGAPSAPSPSPRGAAGASGNPDSRLLFDMDSAHPDEPITEGLGLGAGGGPDVLNSTPTGDDDLLVSYLNRLAMGFNSKVAVETLMEMRSRPDTVPAPMARPPQPQAPVEEEPMMDDGPEMELFAEDEEAPPVSESITEEPVEEAPVDEPAEPMPVDEEPV